MLHEKPMQPGPGSRACSLPARALACKKRKSRVVRRPPPPAAQLSRQFLRRYQAINGQPRPPVLTRVFRFEEALSHVSIVIHNHALNLFLI